MKYRSILLLSSVALVALGACSDDSGSGTPTPTAGPTSTTTASGGSAGTATTSTGGSAGTSATGGSGGGSSTGGSGGMGQGGTTGGATGGSAGSGGTSGGTAGAAGSAGGTGGAGGGGQDAGTDAPSSDARPSDGSSGDGGPRTAANIMPFSDGTIRGTATFTASGADVTITVVLENCPQGAHPMHIHQGTGCASMAEQGVHWDTTRGEDIGPNGGEITCGADMRGMLTYTRLGSHAKPWTIGGPVASNVIGHPVVVHGVGANNMMRHGCGVITQQ